MKALVFSLLCSISAHAAILNDQVSGILSGITRAEDSLVLLKSGRVLRTSEEGVLKQIRAHSGTNHHLTFVEENNQLLTFAESVRPETNDDLNRANTHLDIETEPTATRYTDLNYVPTNLKYYSEAQELMDQLDSPLRQRSQCYQRAHLWAIEMNKMANIHSQKIFLFFTEKYIRDYNFGWWFHVAPFILVKNEEFVIDPQFMYKPTRVQEWTNYFMPSEPICKTAQTYADYDDHQEEAYCYYRKVPMYYFEPMDAEARDSSEHTVISDWIDWQVQSAYASLP